MQWSAGQVEAGSVEDRAAIPKDCATILWDCAVILGDCATILGDGAAILRDCATILEDCAAILEVCTAILEDNWSARGVVGPETPSQPAKTARGRPCSIGRGSWPITSALHCTMPGLTANCSCCRYGAALAGSGQSCTAGQAEESPPWPRRRPSCWSAWAASACLIASRAGGSSCPACKARPSRRWTAASWFRVERAW